MQVKNVLYGIVGLQFIIAALMWYVSISATGNYQTVWGILLILELILMSLLIMVFLRYEGVF